MTSRTARRTQDRPGAQISAGSASRWASVGPIAGWSGPGWPFRAGAVECGEVWGSMPWCRRAPLADHVEIGLQWRFKSRPAVSAGSREAPPQGRDRVREREPPVAHRLARRERRGLEDGPQGRGARPLPGRGREPPRSSTSMLGRPEDLARPVGPRGAAAVDEVVDRRHARVVEQRVLPDELDDRVGDVRRVGGRADLVADDAERLAGVPGAERGRARSSRGSRCPAARGATTSARSRRRHPARPRPRRAASAASLLSAVGVDRAPRIVRRRSRDRRVRSPSKTSLVETSTSWIPRSAQASRQVPRRVAVPPQGEVGVAGAAVDVGPGGGVDDDLGPVALDQRGDRRHRERVEVEVRARPGDRPVASR